MIHFFNYVFGILWWVVGISPEGYTCAHVYMSAVFYIKLHNNTFFIRTECPDIFFIGGYTIYFSVPCGIIMIGVLVIQCNTKWNKVLVLVIYAIWNFWLFCLAVQQWLVFAPAAKREADNNSTDLPWHQFLWVSNNSKENIKNLSSDYPACPAILCEEDGKFMCAKSGMSQLSSSSSQGVSQFRGTLGIKS